MLNPIAIAALAVFASTGPSASPTAGQIPHELEWQVQPATAKAAAGSVQFDIEYRTEHDFSMTGDEVPLATLDGLSAGQLAAASQSVSFTIHHDAGDFRCSGIAGQGRGTGTCVFAANTDFPATLAKRGVGRPDAFQQFQLAMSDIGLTYLDELKREGYATPSADDLVRAGTHGAGLKQLRAMDAVGYHFGDVASLVRVRDHGVSAKYVAAMQGYGYKNLSADELVRLRDHGVSATYVADLRGHGYSGLGPEDLVHLRDHGVSSSYVAELHAIGYDGLKPDVLTRLRDHGVSTGFIRTANQGGKQLSADELIQKRDRGDRD